MLVFLYQFLIALLRFRAILVVTRNASSDVFFFFLMCDTVLTRERRACLFKSPAEVTSFHLVLDCVDMMTQQIFNKAISFWCVHIRFSCNFTKHTAWFVASDQSKHALILQREDLGKSLTTSHCLNYQSDNWHTLRQSLALCLSMNAGANPALRFPAISHDQKARCCPPCV